MKHIIKSILALSLVAGVINAQENESLYGSDWEVNAGVLAFTDDLDANNVTYGSQLSIGKFVNPFIGFSANTGTRGEDLKDQDQGKFLDYIGLDVVGRLPLETTFLNEVPIINFMAPFASLGARTETVDYRFDLVVRAGLEVRPVRTIAIQAFVGQAGNLRTRSEFLGGMLVGARF